MTRLRIGISTCPNDTFAFHALMTGEVDAEGLELEFELLDVEELNRGMAAGRFDVAKMSFAEMLRLADELVLLPSGSALGFGVGPVVLSRPGYTPSPERSAQLPEGARVLCPGEGTTASLLWRLFHPEPARIEQVIFHEIMPRLARDEADLGVCIHEGRFTWHESGLGFVEDLGARWEAETGAPLPLGGIAARRTLAAPVRRRLAKAVRRSIEWSLAHREADGPPERGPMVSMAAHAQDQSSEVIWAHVDLYVNPWTVELGQEGARAIELLSAKATELGLAPAKLPIQD